MKEKEASKKNGSITYQSGNDIIIQPPEYRERTITNTLVNLVIGLLVGAAALWFLIVPAKTQKINHEANQKIVEYSGKMATLSAELSRIQEEMKDSTDSVSTAKNQIEEANAKSSGYENLIKAYQAYQEGNYDNAANAIEGVDAKLLSVEAKSIYDNVMGEVGANVKQKYINQGMEAVGSGDYDNAVASLEKAMDIGGQDSNVMFQLAQAYEGKGDIENANKWYQKIIEEFPGSEDAINAKDYMDANGGSVGTQEPEADEADEEGSGETQSDEDQSGGEAIGEDADAKDMYSDEE